MCGRDKRECANSIDTELTPNQNFAMPISFVSARFSKNLLALSALYCWPLCLQVVPPVLYSRDIQGCQVDTVLPIKGNQILARRVLGHRILASRFLPNTVRGFVEGRCSPMLPVAVVEVSSLAAAAEARSLPAPCVP